MKIINVKADIHPDGDVYVYSKKDKKYHNVGIMIPNNINGFMFMPNGDLCSAPMTNPCYKKVKRLTKTN